MYPKLPFFLSSHAYRDPTVPTTQYNGLCHVTLYHTYPHRSKPSSFQENLKTKKTGDSSHTNPPLACSTPQYAARVTRKTEHECAEKEPELPNLLVLVWTPCSPASSHLARPRLHLHNGRRRPARQERTVRLSRLVSFHALLLSPQCHTTGPGYGPRTAR